MPGSLGYSKPYEFDFVPAVRNDIYSVLSPEYWDYSDDQMDRAYRIVLLCKCVTRYGKGQGNDEKGYGFQKGHEAEGPFLASSMLRAGVSGIRPPRRRLIVSSPLSAHRPSTARRA